MLILKVEFKDMERVGGIVQFTKEVFLKRNWDVFLMLMLKIDMEVLKILSSYPKKFVEISKNIDLRFEVDDNQNEVKKQLHKDGLKAIASSSLYSHEIIHFNSKMDYSLIDNRLLEILDFEKGKGLIPTIVQDVDNTVLMLAYSSKKSLKQTIVSREATYFSRSRNKLWIKGEESGNYQKIKKILFDCDNDTLLFKVEQKGYACHKGSYSCFSNRDFSLNVLYDIIKDRIEHYSALDSYTKRLTEENALLLAKIKEESMEVINFTDRNNLIWEIADLTYFILVLMATKKIKPHEIIEELKRRQK